MGSRDGLKTLAPTEGPCEPFTVEEVRSAIHFTKNGKAAGPSVVASVLMALPTCLW